MPLRRPPPSLALIPRPKTPTIKVCGPIIRKRTMAGGHAHEDHYDPPTGWLFNVPPGEKPKKEGWEGLFYWGFFGGLFLAGVGWVYKPDTSIQTWALEEARRRLEKEGILPPPPPSSQVDSTKRS